MAKYFLLVAFTLMLSACDFAKDIQEMGEKQIKIQNAIKEKHGWNTHVGWNMHNGVLTQVTVIFNVTEVRGETVANLETATQDAVLKSFSSRPKAIFIQIANNIE